MFPTYVGITTAALHQRRDHAREPLELVVRWKADASAEEVDVLDKQPATGTNSINKMRERSITFADVTQHIANVHHVEPVQERISADVVLSNFQIGTLQQF